LATLKAPVGASPGAERIFAAGGNQISKQVGPGRYICGRIQAGTSGYTSDIIEKSGQVAFNRKVTDTEVMPYFFYASVPEAQRVPIICMQQFSGQGLFLFFREVFFEKLRKQISTDEYVVRMNP